MDEELLNDLKNQLKSMEYIAKSNYVEDEIELINKEIERIQSAITQTLTLKANGQANTTRINAEGNGTSKGTTYGWSDLSSSDDDNGHNYCNQITTADYQYSDSSDDEQATPQKKKSGWFLLCIFDKYRS